MQILHFLYIDRLLSRLQQLYALSEKSRRYKLLMSCECLPTCLFKR